MINHILYDILHTWILKHCRFLGSINVHNKAVAMTNILSMNDSLFGNLTINTSIDDKYSIPILAFLLLNMLFI